MNSISHKKQQQLWEKEHQNPYLLTEMDSLEPSYGVALFWDWLKGKVASPNSLEGLEMCCGKGRNCLFLSMLGVRMVGYDFSNFAIKSAKMKASQENLENLSFILHDALKKLPYANNRFDFVVDCFGSTDIETKEGREFARDELIRVLKPGGYYFIYTLSDDDEYHKDMIQKSKAREENAFIDPKTGQFMKVFSKLELLEFYQMLNLVERRRVKKKSLFFGKEYQSSHFWMIFQKP